MSFPPPPPPPPGGFHGHGGAHTVTGPPPAFSRPEDTQKRDQNGNGNHYDHSALPHPPRSATMPQRALPPPPAMNATHHHPHPGPSHGYPQQQSNYGGMNQSFPPPPPSNMHHQGPTTTSNVQVQHQQGQPSPIAGASSTNFPPTFSQPAHAPNAPFKSPPPPPAYSHPPTTNPPHTSMPASSYAPLQSHSNAPSSAPPTPSYRPPPAPPMQQHQQHQQQQQHMQPPYPPSSMPTGLAPMQQHQQQMQPPYPPSNMPPTGQAPMHGRPQPQPQQQQMQPPYPPSNMPSTGQTPMHGRPQPQQQMQSPYPPSNIPPAGPAPMHGRPQPQQMQSPYPPSNLPPGGPAPMHGRPPPPAAAYQQESRPKIDPSQIPRPPLFTRPQADGEATPVYFPKAAVTQGGDSTMQPPPPADSRYTVRDDGNASPDLIRSSVYAFPATRGIWHHTGDLPLGVVCTPLAAFSEDFTPRARGLPDGSSEEWKDPQRVPLVMGSEPPARCGQCQAYLNPFFGTDGTCNLCNSRNWRLQSVISGLPMQYGTVEYEVDGPFITRERPVEPVQIYALDLTCPDLQSYLPILAQLGQDMANHFWRQPDCQLSPRMGVCLVSSVGVVVRDHGDVHGRYSVMSDVTEHPFSPLPLQDWTYDLSTAEGLEAWQKFVNEELATDLVILKDQARGKNAYGLDGLDVSCGGAALAFLADALAETGGRGTFITWRRPNFGVGRLPYREGKNNPVGAPEDYTIFTPLQSQSDFKSKEEETAAAFYIALGKSCAKDRVSLDILIHNSPVVQQIFLDLATLGELCRVSCGKLMWVTTRGWEETIYEELSRQLQSFSGWDTVFKVRCSDGIQVKSFMSNTGTVMDGLVGSLELELQAVTPSTCISVELEHRVGGIPSKTPFVYIQSALLYSTLTGKRRMRVSTLALRTTSVVNDVFRSIDFGAFTTLFVREAALRLRAPNSDEERSAVRTKTREMLYNRCILILACYRQHTPAKSSPPGKMILPDKLQLFPLFCMCLLKSPMLRAGTPRRMHGQTKMSPTGDERAYSIFHLVQAGPGMSMLMVHPNVFSITNTSDGVGRWNSSGVQGYPGYIKMPEPGVPSMETLEDDGVYLIDSGLTIYLYIGKLAPMTVKQQLLGDDSDSSDLMSLVNRLVWQMRSFTSRGRGRESELRPNVPPLVTVAEQEGHQTSLEQDVLSLMINDGMAGEKDFTEFLCSLHRRIRERVEAKS